MDTGELARIVHGLSALALLGGGALVAARLIPAQLRGDQAARRDAAAAAVGLDRRAALPAALLLAASAAWGVRQSGWAAANGWVKIALILSLLAALLWLGAGARMRRMAALLAADGKDAAERVRGLFALWFLLAWPAWAAAALALVAGLAGGG